MIPDREFQTIHETEVVARQVVANAYDAMSPIRDAGLLARGRLAERAVLLNAEGWQSLPLDGPLLSERPHDNSVEVTFKLRLWRDVDAD